MLNRPPAFFLILFFSFFSSHLNSQNLGFELLSGAQFSFLNYDSRKLDYKTISNNDFRVGVAFGDYNKLSSSIILGKSTLKSQYTSEDVTSTIELGYLTIDLPLRFNLGNSIESVSIGPSLLVKNYSSQSINNFVLRNNRMFKPTVLGIYSEVIFKGHDVSNTSINPYFFYRQTINGIEESFTNELTSIHQFGIGLRINIKWDI